MRFIRQVSEKTTFFWISYALLTFAEEVIDFICSITRKAFPGSSSYCKSYSNRSSTIWRPDVFIFFGSSVLVAAGVLVKYFLDKSARDPEISLTPMDRRMAPFFAAPASPANSEHFLESDTTPSPHPIFGDIIGDINPVDFALAQQEVGKQQLLSQQAQRARNMRTAEDAFFRYKNGSWTNITGAFSGHREILLKYINVAPDLLMETAIPRELTKDNISKIIAQQEALRGIRSEDHENLVGSLFFINQSINNDSIRNCMNETKAGQAVSKTNVAKAVYDALCNWILKNARSISREEDLAEPSPSRLTLEEQATQRYLHERRLEGQAVQAGRSGKSASF